MIGDQETPAAHTAKDLKKQIGGLVFQANDDILALQMGYRRVKEGGELSKKEIEVEKSLFEKKKGLEEAIANLETRPDYIKEEKLDKFMKMMKTTVETAQKLLAGKGEVLESIDEKVAKDVQEKAKCSVEEILSIEAGIQNEIKSLTCALSKLSTPVLVNENDMKEEESDHDEITRELASLNPYLQGNREKNEGADS